MSFCYVHLVGSVNKQRDWRARSILVSHFYVKVTHTPSTEQQCNEHLSATVPNTLVFTPEWQMICASGTELFFLYVQNDTHLNLGWGLKSSI